MSTQTIYYGSIAILSFVLLLVYVFRWHKHLDAHVTVIFGMVPMINLFYFLMYSSSDAEAAAHCLKLSYLGGCFLPWVVTMCVAGLCNYRLSRYIRAGSLLLSALFYGLVLTIGHSDIFYKSLTVSQAGSAIVLVKSYGPMHTFACRYSIAHFALQSINRRRINAIKYKDFVK